MDVPISFGVDLRPHQPLSLHPLHDARRAVVTDAELSLHERYPVKSAVPGETVQLSALIQTPETPGRYCTYFRLQKHGKFFGPRVWCDIIVEAADTDSATSE